MDHYFEPVIVHGKTRQLHELTFRGAMGISRIPEHLNEQRITKFLQGVLLDEALPLAMTVQERYYVLLKYLSQQSDGLLATKIDYAAYIKSDQAGIDRIDESSMQVQHLTGAMVVFLEQHCKGVGDWIVGQMALQMACADVPVCLELVPPDLDADAMLTELKTRLNALQDLPQSKFDAIYSLYRSHHARLNTLVTLGTDMQGITVYGGADDAPARFRPAAALVGLAAELERFVAEKDVTDGR